jgi:hypothetical protein
MSRYNRYRWFKQHAGYRVGHCAEDAIALMRAETLLDDAEHWDLAHVEWQYDAEPYEHGVFTDAEVAAKFESNEWTGPYAALLYVGGDVVGALGGITLGPQDLNDPYARVVAAELALEAEDEIRQALGDLLDARITCPA